MHKEGSRNPKIQISGKVNFLCEGSDVKGLGSGVFLLRLFEGHEYAKLGFDEKDLSPPWNFRDPSPPGF